MFNSFLEKETSGNCVKELQPWIPFCDNLCAFCYFAVDLQKRNVELYLSALEKALRLYSEKKYVQSCVFNELYVGGGSPTALSERQIIDLLNYCRETFNFDKDYTTKMAACTINLTNDKLNVLSQNKVDQLDIGVQTFDDNLRKMILLKDKSEDVKKKIKRARAYGMRVSIDLIYNLPGQTLEKWTADLEQAINLEVESVDCYPLDVYPGTPLAREIEAGRVPPLGDCEKELTMYLEAYKVFKENGYLPTCHNRFSRIKEDFEEPSSEIVGTGAGFFMGNLGKILYSDVEKLKNTFQELRGEIFQ
ncbi:MAG: radical SAM protein [Candidatus Bathycorpusculaceae bacterium]